MVNQKILYVAQWSDNAGEMWGTGQVDMSCLEPRPPKLYFWANNDEHAKEIETRFNLMAKLFGGGLRCVWDFFEEYRESVNKDEERNYKLPSFEEVVGTEIGLGEVPFNPNEISVWKKKLSDVTTKTELNHIISDLFSEHRNVPTDIMQLIKSRTQEFQTVTA